MRLLFDQNLSYKLVDSLSDLFPDSTHLRLLELEEANDHTIWELAKKEDYIIVSKDSDFHQFSFLYGPPPKVIWISRGNCNTTEIETVLREHRDDIEKFVKNPESSFLEIS